MRGPVSTWAEPAAWFGSLSDARRLPVHGRRRHYSGSPAAASPKRGIHGASAQRGSHSGPYPNPAAGLPPCGDHNPANRQDRLRGRGRSLEVSSRLRIEPNSDGGLAISGVAASSDPPKLLDRTVAHPTRAQRPRHRLRGAGLLRRRRPMGHHPGDTQLGGDRGCARSGGRVVGLLRPPRGRDASGDGRPFPLGRSGLVAPVAL
jgi:hypothetical protein